MSKVLNVGVIGVGGIARVHMPGWAASPHAQVVAGADLSSDALSKWAKEHDVAVARCYGKPDDLLADPDVDIVDICTPSMYHAPLAIAALNAGKHVICEKPLAPTPKEILQMIDARDRSGKLLMTAQHQRFEGAAMALKKEVDDGFLGEVYYARAWILRRTQMPVGPGFVYKKNSGGGPCIDVGVHALDRALWLMGNPLPVRVTGVFGTHLARQPGAFSDWGGNVPADTDVEDFAAGFIRFDNGAALSLECSWLMHHPTNEEKLWLYGTQGGATLPDATLYRSDNEKKQRYDITLTKRDQPHKPHALECMEFAKAIVEGRPSPVPPEESLSVQRILAGLYESGSTGREVELSTNQSL